jgi:hypothetical protein
MTPHRLTDVGAQHSWWHCEQYAAQCWADTRSPVPYHQQCHRPAIDGLGLCDLHRREIVGR